jgi:hypothetical protein
VTWCSSVASRSRGRRALRRAALAGLLLLAAGVAHTDGGEEVPFEPAPERAPRVLESRWRRPDGCEPAPSYVVREDGARVFVARSETPACRVHGDADAQVRAWLENVVVEVDAPRRGRRHGPPPRPQPRAR